MCSGSAFGEKVAGNGCAVSAVFFARCIQHIELFFWLSLSLRVNLAGFNLTFFVSLSFCLISPRSPDQMRA